ncbi:unnamed protein product [Polarella glacialis]|uniref:Uncharacterized protein n=1 Tax=Polarella glacialis TaxID=89957 RepID=A0A813GVE1_POLGL|nr:unnamed protein product [Polarella glacialis]
MVNEETGITQRSEAVKGELPDQAGAGEDPAQEIAEEEIIARRVEGQRTSQDTARKRNIEREANDHETAQDTGLEHLRQGNGDIRRKSGLHKTPAQHEMTGTRRRGSIDVGTTPGTRRIVGHGLRKAHRFQAQTQGDYSRSTRRLRTVLQMHSWTWPPATSFAGTSTRHGSATTSI